jgi:hypothetical protein
MPSACPPLRRGSSTAYARTTHCTHQLAQESLPTYPASHSPRVTESACSCYSRRSPPRQLRCSRLEAPSEFAAADLGRCEARRTSLRPPRPEPTSRPAGPRAGPAEHPCVAPRPQGPVKHQPLRMHLTMRRVLVGRCTGTHSAGGYRQMTSQPIMQKWLDTARFIQRGHVEARRRSMSQQPMREVND